MSFPSAQGFLATGESADEALFLAFQQDTPLGFAALKALGEAVVKQVEDPVAFIKEELLAVEATAAETVLRFFKRGKGFKVDFNPNSIVGGQIMRLLGTDVARLIITKKLGVSFKFANCCAPICSTNPEDCDFTAAEQIEWQAAPDC